MPRCSEKTNKGLRCKGNGSEHYGTIICAIHLKDYEDMPYLIPIVQSSVTLSTTVTPQEQFDSIIAEMKKIVGDDISAQWYINQLAKLHNLIPADIKAGNADPTNKREYSWDFAVNDTLDHILSSRLAGMPEDVATWSNKDAQIKTLMNKLTTIHKSVLKSTKPINPDRPETLEKAYQRIDELQTKIATLEPILAAAKIAIKDAARLSLWNSGCEDLCYHLGYCSDVMSDCWEPVYEKDGLEGLKENLRSESKHHHNGKNCDDCVKWIELLHD